MLGKNSGSSSHHSKQDCHGNSWVFTFITTLEVEGQGRRVVTAELGGKKKKTHPNDNDWGRIILVKQPKIVTDNRKKEIK